MAINKSIIIVIILFCVGCKQKNVVNNISNKVENKFKKTVLNNGNIIDTQYIYYKLGDSDSLSGITKHCKIEKAEFILAEKLLNDAVKEYNINVEKQWKEYNRKNLKEKINSQYYLIDLNKYDYQYGSYYNNDGDKMVWIRCVCDGYFGLVADGGKCYFSTTLNLNSKTHNGITTHSIG